MNLKPFYYYTGLLVASHVNDALSVMIGVMTCFIATLILALRVLNRRSRSFI